MNHPIAGVILLFLTSGALAAVGWFLVKEWKNGTWKDD